MPKISTTQLIARLEKRVVDLKDGAAFEARDINALLTNDQQLALKTLWGEQQVLRKQHKPPKNELEKQQLGWKTIRDVRIVVCEMALAVAKGSLLDRLKADQDAADIKSAKAFMQAFSDAQRGGRNARSAANIAVRRAGFQPPRLAPHISRKATNRDDLIRKMEAELGGEEGE